MAENNISFDIPDINGKFNYRVGAIIIHDGEILMAKNANSPFYYTVGGRVQFGESSQETLLREVYEETQIHFEIDRLAFIHEVFFVDDSDGVNFHEMAFFFVLKSNSVALKEIKNHFYEGDYGKVELHWLPIENLENLEIYPEFFKTELQNLQNSVSQPKHLITRG
ncbi:MAG: NUDIX domain-containing protein [Defluviitaleaceae bacterium]|nr:NUDIX domain-containing protein [Defluviitaleaceae bacterium]